MGSRALPSLPQQDQVLVGYSMRDTADFLHYAASSMNAPSVVDLIPLCAATKKGSRQASQLLPANPRLLVNIAAMRR